MDFDNMTVADFFEENGGRELCDKYAPELLRYPLKLFYKISCGEMFGLIIKKGLASESQVAAIKAEIEAK